jgi:hypothetical protein
MGAPLLQYESACRSTLCKYMFGYGMDGISKRRRLGLVMLFNDRSPILHIVLQSCSLIKDGIDLGTLSII